MGPGRVCVVKSRPGKKCHHSPELERWDMPLGHGQGGTRGGRAGPGDGDITARAPRGTCSEGGPHLCHVDELVQHLRPLCGPWTAQHHDLHPAGHAVAETYGALQGRAAPHRALQNVVPQVLGLGERWASGWALVLRAYPSRARIPSSHDLRCPSQAITFTMVPSHLRRNV